MITANMQNKRKHGEQLCVHVYFALTDRGHHPQVRLWVKTHEDIQKQIAGWCAIKSTYLSTKEEISSVNDAEAQIGQLGAFRKELSNRTVSSKEPLEALGADIKNAKYESGA